MAAFDLIGDDAAVADAKWALNWLRIYAEPDKSGAYVIRQNALHSSSRFKKLQIRKGRQRSKSVVRTKHHQQAMQAPKKKPTLIYYVNPAVMGVAPASIA